MEHISYSIRERNTVRARAVAGLLRVPRTA